MQFYNPNIIFMAAELTFDMLCMKKIGVHCVHVSSLRAKYSNEATSRTKSYCKSQTYMQGSGIATLLFFQGLCETFSYST